MAAVSQNLQKRATLVVSNLEESVTDEDLSELFGDIGNVHKVSMKDRGVAEIVFVKREDAEIAVEMYDERLFYGRAMKCTLASGGGSHQLNYTSKMSSTKAKAETTTVDNEPKNNSASRGRGRGDMREGGPMRSNRGRVGSHPYENRGRGGREITIFFS